jgi:hypothetical protein
MVGLAVLAVVAEVALSAGFLLRLSALLAIPSPSTSVLAVLVARMLPVLLAERLTLGVSSMPMAVGRAGAVEALIFLAAAVAVLVVRSELLAQRPREPLQAA